MCPICDEPYESHSRHDLIICLRVAADALGIIDDEPFWRPVETVQGATSVEVFG